MNSTQRNGTVDSKFLQLIQQFRTWIFKYSWMRKCQWVRSSLCTRCCVTSHNTWIYGNTAARPSCLTSKNWSI